MQSKTRPSQKGEYMILDFEKFKVTVQLAYRRIGKCGFLKSVIDRRIDNEKKRGSSISMCLML